MRLDHLILNANDVEATARFYETVLGWSCEGRKGPFTTLRVSPDCLILLGPWPTEGGEHLAFAMARPEFDAVVARVRAAGIPYGDTFDAIGNGQGPSQEREDGGARGRATSLYFHDPNRHVIEIRSYD